MEVIVLVLRDIDCLVCSSALCQILHVLIFFWSVC